MEEKVDSLVKPLVVEGAKNKIIWLVALVFVLGTVSGWGLFRLTGGSAASREAKLASKQAVQLIEGEEVEVGKVYGSSEADAFSDSAQGVVEVNEEGEVGTHRLLREGGESQTVHLTSSVLDLDIFIDKKVEIWGETNASEKVGWLMDVGRVKVLE